MDTAIRLRDNLRSFYNLPVRFWQKVLGDGMHFHLGHYSSADDSLERSMEAAVQSLAERIARQPIRRILDLGCGWGGPAFQLATKWEAEVLGFTISPSQANFVNSRARVTGIPVRGETLDLETFDFQGIGKFEVLWMCEALEHIADRRRFLSRLREAASKESHLAITMNCRSPNIPRAEFYNEFMGIQPLETAEDLFRLLADTGWNIYINQDCSSLTLPTWAHWIKNLTLVKEDQAELAIELTSAFQRFRKLYEQKSLQSIQIVAKYAAT
jgi:cyclopropane fatty-acyl-phospholipid synthase-like methyltransferase